MQRRAERMRRYWEDRAGENAVWYVDTSCDRDQPDMEAFFAAGPKVVDHAFVHAPVKPPGRDVAVEIGSGLGRICLALSDHFERVVGVDVSEQMVAKASALVRRDGVTFVAGSGSDLGAVDDASADLVVTFTVFQHQTHVDLIQSYLRESARVLKPGGVLAAQWNDMPHPRRWRLRRRWLHLRSRLAGTAGETRDEPEFTGLRVPYPRMEAMLRDAGLRVAATDNLGTLFAWVWAVRP